MVWSPGDTVGGRYRLDRLIGEGGMGVVWAAVQLVTRKPVALKALRSVYASDKQVHQRFLREARAACAVRHPNVVEIHDVIVVEDGLPVMVMDLLEGESLGQRLVRETSIGMEELATIMIPVVSAVGTAHTLGIVHRDLKPDNIFLATTATGSEVKVLDFGIAKLTATDGDAASTAGLTGTGAMLGTPYYMAPEQIYGEKDIDHRADIWAIGVILYECLAGVRPTQADSIGQILRIVTRDGIKPLRTVRPEVPADILDLVDRLLSSDRAKRPSSLAEVADALKAHTQGKSFTSTSPRGYAFKPPATTTDEIGEAATLAASAPGTLSSTTTTLGKTGTTPRKTTLAMGSVLAIGVLGVGVFFATRPASTPITPLSTASDTAMASDLATATVTVKPSGATVSSSTPVVVATVPVASDTATVIALPNPSAAPSHRVDPNHRPAASTLVAALSASAAVSAAPSATHSPGGVVDKPPF
ncbi:serine/threonine-protein kinase [soil metagenome]